MMDDITRIANALERIAAALEGRREPFFTKSATPTIKLQIDGQEIARAVVRETLRKAARGPSSLIGGKLSSGEKNA